ncbi:MAG: YggS family pyridoxal phosphate-dependent enzyme [Ruminococcaceae bacterium]|nr:YggS family pyridoxal phosphate-dependent enzyme [Oscillospiraceae bacterium]
MITSSFDDERCQSISENLKLIREKISDSAVKSGRNFEDIKLMAVTKTVPVEYINYSIDNCGIDLIGENKVQEFLSKKDTLHLDNVSKHLIGHLQTNKVKKIVPLVDMIQSVDSVHLAEEISKQALNNDLICNILLEVNIGSEESKTGFDKSAFLESLSRISELPNLNVKGIMTIPPICDNEKELKNYFLKMSQYFNDIKEKGYKNFNMEILSMGMSGDYESAIECGANLVRIGSLIYGARIYK